MDQLVVRDGVRRVAIRGTPEIIPARAGGSARQRADTAWRELGADALFAMDEVSASGLASALGLLTGYGERVLPVPLAGPAPGGAQTPGGTRSSGDSRASGGGTW
ncbi:hypothetical protein [Protofrankia coriariae]|uniref:Uncharacterized protein n=2 Tax=Protofrankia TaxID=2994361 RepID=A0ABR5F6E0_9ACTN|nr:hypothetical protein [Protofrankia coriariae]KLL12296.1 hypothetical protein FrCorBMG51_06365 [Protofrankia coriariae]